VTDNDVREVLDTGLFSSRGGVRLGWAHQSYAEFLAALYLVEKNVVISQHLKNTAASGWRFGAAAFDCRRLGGVAE
jgi:hypothetical protein